VNAYSGQAPDTTPAADWRAAGLCRRPAYKDQADRWFATAKEKLARETAEQTCRQCPSLDACGLWAVLTGVEYGTWGALHEEQRLTLRRQLTAEQLADPAVVAAAIREFLATVTARTLRAIWDERTYLLPDGHLGWMGKASVDYGGRSYTKKQIAYYVDRGELPHGSVKVMCGVGECVLPAHIADQVERQALKAAAERLAAQQLAAAS
jgi:hypothetical protein